MSDYFEAIKLDDIRIFLWTGHPPIIIQLVAFNTILMVIIILRRARSTGGGRRPITSLLQWMLIATNLAVLCQQQWMPYLDKSKSVIMDQVDHIARPY